MPSAFTKDDRVLYSARYDHRYHNQPGTVLHLIPTRGPSAEDLYVLRLDTGQAIEATPEELKPCATPRPMLEPLSREDLHSQLCRVYSRLMGRMVDDRMWDVLAIIEAHQPLGSSPDQVCGAVEPNQSRANAALCDKLIGHKDLWHEGFAHGPAAKERPGRHRWAIATPNNLHDLLQGSR